MYKIPRMLPVNFQHFNKLFKLTFKLVFVNDKVVGDVKDWNVNFLGLAFHVTFTYFLPSRQIIKPNQQGGFNQGGGIYKLFGEMFCFVLILHVGFNLLAWESRGRAI